MASLSSSIAVPPFIEAAIAAGKARGMQVSKGEVILHQGDNVVKSYWVGKGLLRSYTVDDQGKIHIFMFAPEGWIISDMHSISFGTPSELFIDAMEPSYVVEVSQQFLSNEPFGDNSYQLAVEKLLRRVSILQKRIIMLMSASAAQRYEHFLQTYPDLVHRVPLKWIASYLGITPEALSTIRGRIKEKSGS